MAQTKAKSTKAPTAAGTPAKKRAPAKKGATAPTTGPVETGKPKQRSGGASKKDAEKKGMVDSTAELSDDVLKAVEAGQRAAIDAVHRFLETVDEALPAIGERPSRREKVIDAALEMADRLTTTQYEFLRTVVRSAEKSLGASPEAK